MYRRLSFMETQVIGRNIKAFRERLGLNQDQLAEFLGVKREMVSYYENGTRTVPLESIKKLADFFGVELIDLIEENADLKTANVAFAFRANELSPSDFENITTFRKIVKNYLKLTKLNEK